MIGNPRTPAAVWGRDDLTCPVSHARIQRLRADAFANPWPGNEPLLDRRHCLDTTAITEPGRLTRVMFSLDVGYHASGWFANSDYERCLHLSVSHPRPDIVEVKHQPPDLGGGSYLGVRTEAPTDGEVRAWGRVLFRDHCRMAWLEPPASVFDRYRTPGVSHLRLYLDQEDRPIQPRGEVYHLRPFEDGSSPEKITEGRAGGDVR